jgi:hypothetical protein
MFDLFDLMEDTRILNLIKNKNKSTEEGVNKKIIEKSNIKTYICNTKQCGII